MGKASVAVEPRRAASRQRRGATRHPGARIWTHLLPALRGAAHGRAVRRGNVRARGVLAVAYELCLVCIPWNMEPARFLVLPIPAGGRQRDGTDGGSLRREQAGP